MVFLAITAAVFLAIFTKNSDKKYRDLLKYDPKTYGVISFAKGVQGEYDLESEQKAYNEIREKMASRIDLFKLVNDLSGVKSARMGRFRISDF